MNKKRLLLNSVRVFFLLAVLLPVSPARADTNPPPQKEKFSHWPDFGAGETWRFYGVNGNGSNVSVNGVLPFDNSTLEITPDKKLLFRQVYDDDFEAEYPFQYNNVFMIGFQGYRPTHKRDIVWRFDMKFDPNTYGTAGFFIEPRGSYADDGSVVKPFDFFGVSFSGGVNLNAGVSCSDVVDFELVSQTSIAGVDPFAWNTYEIRFHLVDRETVEATISVDDTEVCHSLRENYGATEVQIWLDNNQVLFDPTSPLGYILTFGNEETPQSVLFDNIKVKAKPSR
jgi:hypothetical protein